MKYSIINKVIILEENLMVKIGIKMRQVFFFFQSPMTSSKCCGFSSLFAIRFSSRICPLIVRNQRSRSASVENNTDTEVASSPLKKLCSFFLKKTQNVIIKD